MTYTQPGKLSPIQAAEIAGRARRLLRAGRLTHHAYAVLDALLWGSRSRGDDTTTVSYSRLQALAHVARATVAKAITQLIALGLIQRTKRRVLMLWANGGRAWRQLTNCYRLVTVHREFTAQGDIKQTKILSLAPEPTTAEQHAAQNALAQRRDNIMKRLMKEVPMTQDGAKTNMLIPR